MKESVVKESEKRFLSLIIILAVSEPAGIFGFENDNFQQRSPKNIKMRPPLSRFEVELSWRQNQSLSVSFTDTGVTSLKPA